MTKYRVSFLGSPTVKALEVLKETEKQVIYYYHGRKAREFKSSQYARWFDTMPEARAFMVERQKLVIESLERRLEDAHGVLVRLAVLAAPEVK